MNTRMPPRAPQQSTEGDDYIVPLKELLPVIWRRLWVIMLIAVLFCGIAVSWSLLQAPIYQASIKILVGQDRGLATDVFNVPNLADLTLTMSEAVVSRPVAEGVVKRLDLEVPPDVVLAGISVEPVEETQFIEVSYADTSPKRAQRVVNTVGEVFSKRISEAGTGSGNITATVWEKAEVPTSPVSPNPQRYGFLALMLGIVVGVGLVMLLEYLDDSWDSPEEVERVSGVPNLAAIPELQLSAISKARRG
jgi:capsular polysaccharide biosynthesis protein